MTVSTTSNRISYTGNGSTTVFAFPYKFIATSDIKVYVSGTLQTSGYTVGTPSDTGANVTFTTAPASAAPIVILSDPARTQSTSLPSTGPFPAKTVETAFDKLTLITQRLYDLASRALTLSDADTSTANLTVPTPVPRRALIWDVTGTSLTNSSYDPDTGSAAAASAAASATAAASSASTASTAATSAASSATSAATSATNAAAAVTSAIGVTVQGYDAATAKTNVTQSYSKAQRGAVVALTDAASITSDFATGNNFSVTLGGNRTLANPSNLVVGQSGVITVTQDATGSRTLAFASNWKFPSGTAPTLTTTANAVDEIAYYVDSSSRIAARLIADVR